MAGEPAPGDERGEPRDRSDALEIAREEAHRTIDAQLSTVDDVDAKALSIFRLNVAVVSLLVSALSVGVASGLDATTFLTPVIGASLGLFVLSAAAAGLTYTAAGRTVGVGPGDLRAAAGTSAAAYRERLLEGYADWIRANERTNGRKALLVTLSLLGTVAGVLVLGVGVVEAATGALLVPAAGTVLALLVLVVLVDLHGQVGRWRRGPTSEEGGAVAVESLDEPMAGQRTFTGRDRRR